MSKKAAPLILVLIFLLCGSAGAVTVEQIQPVMPEICVYVHDDSALLPSLSADSITASLDGEPLRVTDLSRSEQGIYYVFMLDISSSVPTAHFNAAKQALLQTYDQLRQQDQLALITFGNEVNLLLEGNESVNEVHQVLDSLRCSDSRTCFYSAINTLVETAGAKEEMRRVAVVVSDGVDDTDSGMTEEQLNTILHQGGVSVYALGVDSVQQPVLDHFSSFVQLSGGTLFPFSPDSAAQALSDLLARIGETWKLTLLADSNLADGRVRSLEMRFGDSETLAAQIRPEKWTPDQKPPYVVSLTTDSAANTVTVTFSETMEDLTILSNYVLRAQNDEVHPLEVVSAGAAEVVLSSEDTLQADWLLELSGMTDASMEHNALVSCTLPLSGQIGPSGPAAPDASGDSAQASAVREVLKLLLLPGILLLAAAAAVVAVLVYRKKKNAPARPKRKKKPKKDDKQPKQSVRFFFQNPPDSKK